MFFFQQKGELNFFQVLFIPGEAENSLKNL